MRQAIIIGTSKGRKYWADRCSKSCDNDKYETVIVNNDGFELAHINEAYKMGFDEFLYIHDTCKVKTHRLFDILFEEQKGKSVALSDYPSIYGMYLGKYTHEGLSKISIPKANDKFEAVDFEIEWTKEYALKNEVLVLNPPLRDGNNFVTINKKMYMKLENDFIIKYKGTWSRSMI